MKKSAIDYLSDSLADGGLWAVAILDGASVNGLVQKMFEEQVEYECLFAGELEPDMAEVSPYIARIEPDSEFADWVLSGWGGHWGIIAVVPAGIDIAALRRHMRRLNMVYGTDNQPLYFRWYDPRVLRMVLPACDSVQLQEMFGPALRFITEGETPGHGYSFSLVNGELVQERFSVELQ